MPAESDEWLESDGAGGFASGPVQGPRTRRYQALLLSQRAGERFVLVNGVEAWIVRDTGRTPLSTTRYLPDVLYPEGYRLSPVFEPLPWPRWTFDLGGGLAVQHEVLADHVGGGTILRWRLLGQGGAPCLLEVRPMLTGRNYHALHRRNDGFAFVAQMNGAAVTWCPYRGVPPIQAIANGAYTHAPLWFMNVLYQVERDRGFEGVEDMASPGLFSWDLDAGEAVLVLRTEGAAVADAARYATDLIGRETARRHGQTSIDLAADAYMAVGPRLLAGYPWFEDWGRDTFIAMRGLLTARGQYRQALAILLAWAGRLSEGMLPNRLSGDDAGPEYNTVDAALWFVVAGYELIAAAAAAGQPIAILDQQTLRAAWEEIVTHYAAGTRFGIRADSDGLLQAGEEGTQLTWMDARVDGRAVTPRVGKPVEVQALWINALHIAGAGERRWLDLEALARTSFVSRFAKQDGLGLHDIVDAGHARGTVDAAIRPNQIFAVGGLPFPLIDGALAASVLATVEDTLLTPLGLRTLAASDPAYVGRYEGDVFARDHAYHQGTAWPWLLGPFVEAWLRVHGDTPANRAEARTRFLAPLQRHLGVAGIGHVSEIVDGDAPHTPRGCPFQAWSLGEMVRIGVMVEDRKEGLLF